MVARGGIEKTGQDIYLYRIFTFFSYKLPHQTSARWMALDPDVRFG